MCRAPAACCIFPTLMRHSVALGARDKRASTWRGCVRATVHVRAFVSRAPGQAARARATLGADRRGARAQRLLVCGWGETPFMLDLLRELDAGTGALPRGSEVVLLNAHPEERVSGHLEQVRGGSGLRSIRLRHVRANPLTHEGVSQARRRPATAPWGPCRISGARRAAALCLPCPPTNTAACVHPCQRCLVAAGWRAPAPARPRPRPVSARPRGGAPGAARSAPARRPERPRPAPERPAAGAQVDMRGVTASLVLSDVLWRDSGVDNGGAGAVAGAPAGALEKMAEADYLRLDSLLLTCQLHVRGLLQARPPAPSGP